MKNREKCERIGGKLIPCGKQLAWGVCSCEEIEDGELWEAPKSDMPIEKQVVSLEIAKRLKALGVPQESYHSWYCFDNGRHKEEFVLRGGGGGKTKRSEMYSAFSVAELGGLLPEGANTLAGANKMHVWNRKQQHWVAALSHTQNEDIEKKIKAKKEPTLWYGDTEADARGNMLVYLIENKLV